MQIEETVLDQIRSRPRFKIITESRREQYTAFLKRFLTEKSHEFSGNINNETAVITVKNNQHEYWKPNLSLRTETDEENKTVIRGVLAKFCGMDFLHVPLLCFQYSVDGIYHCLVC